MTELRPDLFSHSSFTIISCPREVVLQFLNMAPYRAMIHSSLKVHCGVGTKDAIWME